MIILYKRTIIASIGAASVFFALSVMCEFMQFPHYQFALNYFAGITCSLIVVIITSYLQFKHENNRALDEYSAALRIMISALATAFCGFEDGQIKDKLCESVCYKIKESFDSFERCDKELVWFSIRKQKQQGLVYMSYQRLYCDFMGTFYRSKRDAFCKLRFHKEYIALIDSALEIVNHEHDRFSIEDNKRLAMDCLKDRTSES